MALSKFKSTEAGSTDLTLVLALNKLVDAIETRLAAAEATVAAVPTTYMTVSASNAALPTENVAADALWVDGVAVKLGSAA